jgi:hypothetical protein
MAKVHPCALYIGAGLDIRRPWNTLAEVSLFVMIDYDRDLNFFDELLRETETEELELMIVDQKYTYDQLKECGRIKYLYSINPLVFIHPTNNRRIHYYHSIVIPNRSTAPEIPIYPHYPDYPLSITQYDIEKCGTIILAGYNPHEIVLLMMKKRYIDMVAYAGTVYRVVNNEPISENWTVIRNLMNNCEKVRRIIYFPVLASFGEHDEENVETYDSDDRYEFLTIEELCDFIDDNSN